MELRDLLAQLANQPGGDVLGCRALQRLEIGLVRRDECVAVMKNRRPVVITPSGKKKNGVVFPALAAFSGLKTVPGRVVHVVPSAAKASR